MKRTEISLSKISKLIAIAFLTGFLFSFGSGSSSKNSEDETHEHMENEEGHHHEEGEEHDHHDADEDHHHHDEAMEENTSGQLMWMPSGTAFSGNLKLAKGNAASLNAEIVSSEDGNKILSLQPSGEEVILLLDSKDLGSIGAELQFNTNVFKGTIAIVHHYRDDANYDMVALGNQNMKLLRVKNGKSETLDQNKSSLPSEWSTLKLSAAGEHYKGYLNGEQLTHGHGEEQPAGKVGILIKGNGKVMLKKLNVIPLTE